LIAVKKKKKKKMSNLKCLSVIVACLALSMGVVDNVNALKVQLQTYGAGVGIVDDEIQDENNRNSQNLDQGGNQHGDQIFKSVPPKGKGKANALQRSSSSFIDVTDPSLLPVTYSFIPNEGRPHLE
jgi:hypothetical protein